MEILEISEEYPIEEKYSLTDAYGENAETDTWLQFARDCGYLSMSDYKRLSEKCTAVGKMLGAMLLKPEPFLLRI